MIEHVATLEELQTWYSLSDVADVNDALDAMHAAQVKAQKAAAR